MSPVENLPFDSEPQEAGVVYVRKGQAQAELADYLKKMCTPLLGSGAYADGDGSIFYYTWRDIESTGGLLPPDSVIISDLHPQAVIYAPHTRFIHWKEQIIMQVRADGGSVEAAIRAMDHILEDTRGRERLQMDAVKTRAHETLSLFRSSFSDLSDDELSAARDTTYALLSKVGFNPDSVYGHEKRRIAEWLPKGSFGRDSLGRRNKLISAGALEAAYHRAVFRQRGLGEIERKFVGMREALVFEREFSRTIFTIVSERVRPEAMPVSSAFRYPGKPVSESQSGIIVGMLNTIAFQLNQPRVRPYRPIGREIAQTIRTIANRVIQDDRSSVSEENLFATSYEKLTETLNRYAGPYP